jgi:hypothetical protein
MSTRARIGRRNADGSISSIYLHCDGYPAVALRVLLTHYPVRCDVDRLLSGGDLTSFGCPVREPAEGRVSQSLDDYLEEARHCWAEHAYLYEDGTWLHSPVRRDFR